MKYEKYLPIGSVVMLKGGTKRIMITGFCCVGETKEEKVYDYCGCLFPEGYVTSNNTLLFDHEQIAEIHHIGLHDEEEKQFKEKLNQYLQELK
jgi:hypothetical protein